MCTVAVSYTSDDGGVYILGDTFLRNFVTTFDFQNQEIQLSISPNAPTNVTVVYHMSGWKIFAIILAALCASILTIWCIIRLCNR